MKIHEDNGVPRNIAHPSAPVQPGRLDAGRAASPVGRDRVELSDRARALQVAKHALADLPDVRGEKVRALKQMVQSGAYQVDGERVAERMLADGVFA
ncbi:MAG: flagellar biosynthesis anti-sigma factor FlgM [Candidatus Methylomirabilales bacterium]